LPPDDPGVSLVPEATPLSVAQEGLYYHAALRPRSRAYHEVVSLRRDGPLDVPALEAALAEVVRRHDSLRTCFPAAGGGPVRRTSEAPLGRLMALDVTDLGWDEAVSRATSVVSDLARAPYPLDRGPLIRTLLVHFPGDHHRLYLAMHHLIFDGVSLYRVVLPEVAALYSALARGDEPSLTAPVSYADYARWQQDWMAGERAQKRLAYWREHLADLPGGPAPLPRDGTRREQPRDAGGAVAVAVDASTAGRLREVGRQANASFFQVVAATWALLLDRYGDAGEVVFATAADLRQRPEFHDLVGYCLTPLPLRVPVGGAATVAGLLGAVREELLDALDHVVPFERIVRELPAPATGPANPVYQTMVVLEPPGGEAGDGWSLHQVDGAIGDAVGATHGLDLELELDQRPDGAVAGRLIYDGDLFEGATALRVARHWEAIVRQVAEWGGDLAVADVDPLDEAERRRLLVEWNTAPAPAVTHSGGRALEGEGASPLAGLAALVGLGPAEAVAVVGSTARRFPRLGRRLAAVSGARLVDVPAGMAGDGAGLSRLVSGERVSLVVAHPAVWGELAASGLRGARGVAALNIGGPLSTELAAALLGRFRVLWNAYGPAGQAECVAAGRVEDAACVTVGRPLTGARLYVAGAGDRPAPTGVWGRLLAGGRAVAAGPGPGVVADPFTPGWVWETGDLARWRPDGRLQVAPAGA
jgi:non-ribosomal peptide synthetase component F